MKNNNLIETLNVGDLSDVLIKFLKDNNINIFITTDDVSNGGSYIQRSVDRSIRNILEDFQKYLITNDIIFTINEYSGIIEENEFFKIGNISTNINSVRSNELVRPGEPNQLSNSGENVPNNMYSVTLDYIRRRIYVYFDFLDIHTSEKLKNVNFPSGHNFNMLGIKSYIMSDSRLFNIKILEKNLREKIVEKEAKIKELDILNSSIENYNWIIEYMNANKITKESKSLIKSKMILDSIKSSDMNDDVMLTNISELFELTV